MNWFTENSTVPLVTGALMVMILLGMAFAAREKWVLQLAIAIGLLTAATVICERLIVTEQEEVTECVHQLADLVQANNVPGVLEFVSPTRQDTRDQVSDEMPRYVFEDCRIIGINYFKGNDQGSKNTAEICFVVTVRVRIDNSSQFDFGQRRVTLYFEKESDGKWRVVNYSHEDPRSGIGL